MENGYCANPALDWSEMDGDETVRTWGDEEEEKEKDQEEDEEPTQTVLSLVLDPTVTSAHPCKKAKLSRW